MNDGVYSKNSGQDLDLLPKVNLHHKNIIYTTAVHRDAKIKTEQAGKMMLDILLILLNIFASKEEYSHRSWSLENSKN